VASRVGASEDAAAAVMEVVWSLMMV
jgi:hypothetical protein